MTESQILCEQLANEFREVGTLLQEHLADNGELLPHVFFGDLTRYVLADGEDRIAVVQRLENAMSSGCADIRELISVSFAENIETQEELERAMAGVDGNSIRDEWIRQHPV